MSDTAYESTRDRVEHYFDRTATAAWERLTSDAPVSRIRATVRAGRDRMRATMLSRLPRDLSGARVLDAGCGTGQMTAALAERGAEVVAVDISPSIVALAERRLPPACRNRVRFVAGDMLDDGHGRFDHVMAMDSLIYYGERDVAAALARLAPRVGGRIVFTVAPRTPLLMAMWSAGRLFPRGDRSPTMVPHAPTALSRAADRAGVPGRLSEVTRVSSGFYISSCLELAP
ncbi:magnesium protoporphyrin IX methyltransferase [Tranquillimonas rosea]|uniref:magnesium protoporphyrin IX methyltransferase n=1 Tax=Tranquillimonas rosea TaxID=641238 RepID=UPI003BA9FAD0